MPQGLIVKALSGYYYVQPEGEEADTLVQCRARGIFKKKNMTPLVGDRVFYEPTENGEGTVTELMPRSSELIRPPVSNVEQAILVFSLTEPELNFQLLDKFLVHIENAGLSSVICLTKADFAEDNERLKELADKVQEIYGRIGYEVVMTSSRKGTGTERAAELLAGRISVFSGQSGVGKSSLLNRLLPGLSLETAEISMKLGRGRHTTRHVELIALPGGGYVADTPGFSQLDFLQMETEDLGRCFKEMARISSNCRFRGCTHEQEPGCAVKEALAEGEIAPSRYEHYISFLQEMKDKKRRY
ncbi:ribosome small subunit-dependent GTPase A [Paenibacillus sp. y28]|uniref:ribosome small subunit-dependent GTPase A n=1 Tax=Paenibacillus sp. y28 TaxID=3129110 RepID=UPI003019212E